LPFPLLFSALSFSHLKRKNCQPFLLISLSLNHHIQNLAQVYPLSVNLLLILDYFNNHFIRCVRYVSYVEFALNLVFDCFADSLSLSLSLLKAKSLLLFTTTSDFF